MDLNVIIIPLGLLTVLIVLGMPIGPSFLAMGFLGMGMRVGFGPALHYLGGHSFDMVANFAFIAMPMFVLMGEVLARSGVGAELFGAASLWFGKVRGGLAVASIAACTVFAAMTGLSMAGTLTIGIVAIPEMLKRGYNKGLAAGAIACAGTLGILIPPSLPFIVYGLISEQSVGRLFIAGIIPGVMLAIMYMAYAMFICWRRPELAPALVTQVTWKERFSSLRKLWSALLLVVVVMGALYGGVATPSEVAAIGAIGAFAVALLYRSMGFNILKKVLDGTTIMMGFIFISIVGATLLGYYLTMTGITQGFTNWILSLGLPRYGFILVAMFIIFILGIPLDATAIILITTPLLLPAIKAFGFDPIWWGVLLIMNMQVAYLTPPAAINLFIVVQIAPEIPLGTVFRGAIPFLLIAFVAMVLVAAFPQLALWLPSQMVR